MLSDPVVSAPGPAGIGPRGHGHPDDPELWAGGTLALHARDAPVTLAVTQHEAARMTDATAGAAILGARSPSCPPPSPQRR